jgi:hypothetical protein
VAVVAPLAATTATVVRDSRARPFTSTTVDVKVDASRRHPVGRLV